MLQKAVLLVLDGLGDRPSPELDYLTPLEKANTPNLDRLAEQGICGMLDILGLGKVPASDVAHLTLFGYDIKNYYPGRGPIEVAGLGIKLQPGDVALRGNMGTVNEDMIIVDRRAGRITDVSDFAKDVDGIEIDGVKFIVKPGTAHRFGIVMRGKGLSDSIQDVDPKTVGQPPKEPLPLSNSPEAQFTCEVLKKFLKEAHNIFKDKPINKQRQSEGLPPANYILVRGAGFYAGIPSFNEQYGLSACVIAGGGLYKGVGAYLGMDVIDVPGATALPNTDVHAKFVKVLECIDKYDFIFVHVKAADSLGEDGNYKGKTEFIEKVDKALSTLFDLPNDTLLVVTGDHSTPWMLKRHSADPVPILMKGQSVRVDNINTFGERACAQGGMGKFHGLELMPEIINLLGLGKLVGA